MAVRTGQVAAWQAVDAVFAEIGSPKATMCAFPALAHSWPGPRARRAISAPVRYWTSPHAFKAGKPLKDAVNDAS